MVVDERGEELFVRGRLEIAETRATPRRNEEVEIERDRALSSRPVDDAAELRAISLRRRRLDDEVEPMLAETRQRFRRRLERAAAVAEIVVTARIERVNAHRDAADAGILEGRDPFVGQHRAIRA